MIQGNGRFLPPHFALKVIPAGNGRSGFGLPSLLRMQRLGGTLLVRPRIRGRRNRASRPSRSGEHAGGRLTLR